MTRLAFIALVAAAACGGKSQPATSTIEHSDHMTGHDEHAGMPPEVVAFHDRLAPLWHAAAGQERIDGTCGAVGDFEDLLGNLARAAPPPTVDATAWGERIGELRGHVSALGADCVDSQAADFDARFERVHGAFHALIELLPHDEPAAK